MTEAAEEIQETVHHFVMDHSMPIYMYVSLVPRPSSPSAFDCSKTKAGKAWEC